MQMIAALNADDWSEVGYQFEGKHLMLAKNGYVLIFESLGQDPLYVIDPPWAQDSAGNSVRTGYRVEGDTLVQWVDMPEGNLDVYADPYLRNSVVFGNYPTSDLVLTRAETATIAASGGLCAIIRAYPFAVACGVIASLVGIASANNKCLGDRVVYLPGTNPKVVAMRAEWRRIASWPMLWNC